MSPHYTVGISDTTYDIDADSTLNARCLAASKYKGDIDGPYVGRSVSELANCTTILNE